MPKNNRWKKLRSKTVFRDPYFSVRLDEVIKPSGLKGKYAVLEKPPGTSILPVDNKGNIYLVKEHRYPLNEMVYQLPGGALEKGISLLANAKKELLEETGFTAKKWTYLGSYSIGPGHENTIDHLYLAQDLIFGQRQEEVVESIEEVEKFSTKQVKEMLLKNKIRVASSALAVSLYLQYYAKS